MPSSKASSAALTASRRESANLLSSWGSASTTTCPSPLSSASWRAEALRTVLSCSFSQLLSLSKLVLKLLIHSVSSTSLAGFSNSTLFPSTSRTVDPDPGNLYPSSPIPLISMTAFR